MNADILVAKMMKNGMTREKAELNTVILINISRTYGLNPYDLVDEFSDEFELNEAGSFIMNNMIRNGHNNGRVAGKSPNKYVERAILK